MKTTAFGVSGLIIIIVSFLALLQVVNINTRATSLQISLQEVMEASLSTAMNQRAYTVADEDQLVADVIEGIVLALDDERAELSIQVNEVDRTLGIISLSVEARYPSVVSGDASEVGEGSVVRVDRTVILEQVDRPASGSFTVSFTDPTRGWNKSYTFTLDAEGESNRQIPYPAYTPDPSKRFVGWEHRISETESTVYTTDAADRAAMQSLSLDKDYNFVAVLEDL